MDVVASLSQGRTAAAQYDLFTHKSVPVIFEPPCIFHYIFLRLAKQSQCIPLQNVVYFIILPFLVRKIFTFYINDVLLFKCPIPGSKG